MSPLCLAFAILTPAGSFTAREATRDEIQQDDDGNWLHVIPEEPGYFMPGRGVHNGTLSTGKVTNVPSDVRKLDGTWKGSRRWIFSPPADRGVVLPNV